MVTRQMAALKENSPYNAAITREQFLFYEMRTTPEMNPIEQIWRELRTRGFRNAFLHWKRW